MLQPEDVCFVRVPDTTNKRELVRARVLSAKEDVLCVEPGSDKLSLDEGMEILIYFDQGREFMQQTALVVPTELDAAEGAEEKEEEEGLEPRPLLGIQLIGAPISAEQRGTFRVRTSGSYFSVSVGRELDCGVLDVSSTGFAFDSDVQHKPGELLDVVLRHNGVEFKGQGCVQNVTGLRRGRMRIGLRAVDLVLGAAKLARGLAEVSFASQRRMVRGSDVNG